MFQIDTSQLQANIVAKLKDWVDTIPNADDPIIVTADGDEDSGAKTPRQIYNEVANDTPEGRKFIQRWVELATTDVMEAALGGEEDDGEEEDEEQQQGEAAY